MGRNRRAWHAPDRARALQRDLRCDRQTHPAAASQKHGSVEPQLKRSDTMAPDISERRTIYVVADSDSLIRALAEHRQPNAGWRFTTPSGSRDPEALVILDIADDGAR